jgi:hypothetical protein
MPVLPGVQSVLNAGTSLQLATQLFGATEVCVQNIGDVAGVVRIVSPLGYETYLPVNAGQFQCVTHDFAGVPVSVTNLTSAPMSVTSKLPTTSRAR